MGHPGAPNHDHHRSIWFAHNKLLGIDFWSDRTRQRESVRRVGWSWRTVPEQSWPSLWAGSTAMIPSHCWSRRRFCSAAARGWRVPARLAAAIHTRGRHSSSSSSRTLGSWQCGGEEHLCRLWRRTADRQRRPNRRKGHLRPGGEVGRLLGASRDCRSADRGRGDQPTTTIRPTRHIPHTGMCVTMAGWAVLHA